MLRIENQIKLSEYERLYDILIPDDNILRKIKENIDFSFVNPMLAKCYCEHFGRPAKEPEMMFKLLFLKKLYDLSDEKLIENARMHMAYKYFLNLNPEDEIIDSSLLTKFRKTRVTEDILDEMLRETIRQAINKKLIKSTAIIVDATHSKANAAAKSPTEILRKLTKELRKEIYREMYDLSDKFPDKPSETADLTEEIEYTKKLMENTKNEIMQAASDKIKEKYEQIHRLLEDEKIRKIRSAQDEDARFGHKGPTQTFFGYKIHLGLTEERFISAVEVTSGEAADGDVTQKLTEQSIANGIEVKEINGDMAYSTIANIEYCKENNIALISKLNPLISNTAEPKNDGFIYNKDAGTMQCPAGNLAINCRHQKPQKEHWNSTDVYKFSKFICRKCPLLSQCKVGLSKTQTYSVSIMSDLHQGQLDFQNTEYFKERSRGRYKIEAKNAELKCTHGLDRADSVGLFPMRLQSYFTAFTANVKRIVKLSESVTG